MDRSSRVQQVMSLSETCLLSTHVQERAVSAFTSEVPSSLEVCNAKARLSCLQYVKPLVAELPALLCNVLVYYEGAGPSLRVHSILQDDVAVPTDLLHTGPHWFCIDADGRSNGPAVGDLLRKLFDPVGM